MYSFCYLHLPKFNGNECVIALHPKQGQSIVTEEGCIFTRTRICAPSNSDVDFLLSQVSHLGCKCAKNAQN